MYHYLGCGLSNVYLKNGYRLAKTPYGEGVSIHDLDGLHDAIGAAIVSDPHPMMGEAFRFLRVELDLSQAGLAALLGCDEQAVARWEKGTSKVNAPAERLLRLLYKQMKLGEKKLAPLLKMLQQLESAPVPRKIVASERNDSWSVKAEVLRAR
jgi:putative transcriptional regulator